MSKDTETEFDGFAGDYNRSLRDSLRASGETPDYFSEYKVHHLIRRVQVGPDSKVLDFGCGIGNLSGALRRLIPGVSVDGYDPSMASLEQIPADARGPGLFTSDLAELDTDYNIAVLAGVLHHIRPEKRADTLAEACSRLRPGGSLVVFEHNPLNPLTRRAVDTCPFDKNAILLPAAETRKLFAARGLILVKRDYIVFFPRTFSALRPLEAALGWCPLGAQYAFIGTRER